MFFYVVSRTYAEIFGLLRLCSGLLSNSPGLTSLEPHIAGMASHATANCIKHQT